MPRQPRAIELLVAPPGIGAAEADQARSDFLMALAWHIGEALAYEGRAQSENGAAGASSQASSSRQSSRC